MTAIDLLGKAEALRGPWQPGIVAALNDMHVKLARLEGPFVWHAHADTDELFYVLQGRFDMHYRDRVTPVESGRLIVVPRGVEHRPVASAPCLVMLIEPAGTLNTGASGGELTHSPDWL